MRTHLLTVHLSTCANSVLFKKSFPMPKHSRLFSTFSAISPSFSGFVLSSLIYIEFSFVKDDEYGSICILPHASVTFDKDNLLKMLPFINVHSWLLYQ